jgi:hypothetical protein
MRFSFIASLRFLALPALAPTSPPGIPRVFVVAAAAVRVDVAQTDAWRERGVAG